jgi:hypothetical protein
VALPQPGATPRLCNRFDKLAAADFFTPNCPVPTLSYMMDLSLAASRRAHPRAPAQTLCTEHSDRGSHAALVLDLSETGIRLQRPGFGLRPSGLLPLEFELPEADEIIWASGEVCFDEVWQVPTTDYGLSGFLRTTGIRLVSMAARHRRMLRDYAFAYQDRLLVPNDNPLMLASCYLRG